MKPKISFITFGARDLDRIDRFGLLTKPLQHRHGLGEPVIQDAWWVEAIRILLGLGPRHRLRHDCGERRRGELH